MSIQLTDKTVSEIPLPAEGYTIVYDGDHPKAVAGFGCRVTRAGARSYVLNYRTKAGTERRITIGPARFLDGARWTDGWTATAARDHASKLRREIERGGDPMGELTAARGAKTVADLAARYLEEYAPGKRSRKSDEGILNQIVLPELGTRKVADIGYEDIEALHRKVSKRGVVSTRAAKDGKPARRAPRPAPVRANRAVSLLSKMFALSIRWKMRTDNPAKGIQRNPENKRERYLSGEELGRLTAELAKHGDVSSANAIRLLLLTGARRGEVLAATWSQFDLDQGVWIKPSAHTKQKKDHRVPLSAPARQLLLHMKEASSADRLFDDSEAGRLHQFWTAICKDTKIVDVRVHDLRHTYASILASAGLSLPVIGALLGHTQPATTARYSHLFDDPLRKATERVGQIVTNASNGATAEVRELPRHRGPRVPA